IEYAPIAYNPSEFSSPKTRLVVPVFQKGDDPIDMINHMMSFLTSVVTSRYPPINNQLRTSSNPHQQATINNRRVTIQPIQGRQNNMLTGSSRSFASGSGRTSGKQMVVVCYNCKGEGHMSKQCIKPRRKRDAEWFKDKVLQALGFQNPCYLKKAQKLKPNLYDGSVIGKSNVVVWYLITESSAEQAFWSQYSVQTDEPNLFGTTIVEVPKELPKVSLVNSCLKKLKFHLASFDIVVKERTTATAITEGMWGFKHTKACFCDDIIPFVKNLKELFTSFDQCLIDEVTEVQKVFKQMELAVEQHCVEKAKFQTKMESILQENDRLLTQALSVEIVNIVVHDNDTVILKLKEKIKSFSGDDKERKAKREVEEIETQNLELDHKEKVLVITALKEQLNKLKGKAVLTEVVSLNPIDPALLQVDVAPLAPKLRKNRKAHTDYIRHTQEEAATLREIVESERLLSPLNTSLDYASVLSSNSLNLDSAALCNNFNLYQQQ
nr:hypothetical protein [Tanacetum cinerariifolium]